MLKFPQVLRNTSTQSGSSISAGGDIRGNACLIVNADDYGRFASVSRGIIDAAVGGIVTATGILANEASLSEHLRWLALAPGLDTGIHLTLSSGRPLTQRMRRNLQRFGGVFPNKFQMMMAILSRAVSFADVIKEWAAQIERVLSSGTRLSFANSHEHLHMHPRLFQITLELAERYGIEHVRFVKPKLTWRPEGFFNLRDIGLAIMSFACTRFQQRLVPAFEGLSRSGRINIDYLLALMPRLNSGGVYELMCHPGRFDPNEISDPRLRAYHDWEGELRALTSPDVAKLCETLSIRLIRFRDLGSILNPPPAAVEDPKSFDVTEQKSSRR